MNKHPVMDCLSVRLVIAGKAYAADRDLPEVAVIAEGPQALESGLMSIVREICQEVWRERHGA